MRRQLRALVTGTLLALAIVAATAVGALFSIRKEIGKLSREAAPLQVNLARLQQGFERINANLIRVSAAATEAEITSLDAETQEVMGRIETTLIELQKIERADRQESLDRMRATMKQLADISRARLDNRRGVSGANEAIGVELDQALQITAELSAAMAALQERCRKNLASAKQTSQDASAEIRSLMIARERLAELRLVVHEVRHVDKKIRLNVIRDKATAALDAMTSQNLSDAKLTATMRGVAAKLAVGIESEQGLLQARAAELASPDAEKARTYEQKLTALNTLMDALNTSVSESIDAQELASARANQTMNVVTEQTGAILAISTLASEVQARARATQAIGWQLVSAQDTAGVERAKQELEQQRTKGLQALEEMRRRLIALGRKPDAGSATSVAGSLQRVVDRLAGASGTAMVVNQNLEMQARADRLSKDALRSIEELAVSGSASARDAEAAQDRSLAQIEAASTVTLGLLILAGGGAVAVAWRTGSRVRASILAAEERQVRDRENLERMVKRIRESAALVRKTSNDLSETSGLVVTNIEAATTGTRSVRDSILKAAQRTGDAARLGEKAEGWVKTATSTVERLNQTGKSVGEISSTTQRLAQQTQILSLNAAIEASRAGEFGRSFGVVADEVRSLALKASEAAQEIEERVQTIDGEVHSVVDVIGDLSKFVSQIQTLQREIADLMEMQASMAGEINAGIEQTAVYCTGGGARRGIKTMSAELARMAGDLDELCRS